MDILDVEAWPVYGSEAQESVARLVRSGMVYDYTGKRPVVEFEREFAALHGSAHVVTFNSGTSALFAALSAIGIGEGDEVIVPNLTFLASASPLIWLGAHPVLVDSSEEEPSVDPVAIRAAITSRTRAVVVTHLFGNPVDVEAIARICAEHNLRFIEDCSHAHASTVGAAHVGTFGDVAIYSIGAGKLISGGHGGALVTNDAAIRDLAMLVGHFKPRTRTDLLTESLRPYSEFALGGNLRLSPLAAALALDHLRCLDELSKARCTNVGILDEALAGLLHPVRSAAPRNNRSHFDIVYRMPSGAADGERDRLVSELTAAGVPAGAPSTRPLNRVLRKMPNAPSQIRNVFLQRLHTLAQSAPSDLDVKNSVLQHDRMISFPAGRLYSSDTAAAEWVATKARVVVNDFFGGSGRGR